MTERVRPRLVVLRALKLGDFLTGIPALRALARAYPGHERILAAPAHFQELLQQTGMERIHDTSDLSPLGPELHGADIAVDLHGRGPESQRLLLALEPRRLLSFRHADVPSTDGSPIWRPDEHEISRWCRMLTENGIPADPSDMKLDASGLPPSPSPGATVVHPGAASQARRWPPERFAAVAREEAGAGRPVVVTGSRGEAALARTVADLAGLSPDHVLAGCTTLAGLASLVASAGRVVSGDTGIAHLASATGTPSVVIFGPIPPSEWGPPESPLHLPLWAGRRGDPHGEHTDPGLLEITVSDVLAALRRL
ncbi:MAG TPA: glycosyltransferase family 9 protein [Acidimicrobiales bacterium]|nr:glycosyltransferase family 9 protein [Acidimicrobiales bacterium]